jgi:hypothetical protein
MNKANELDDTEKERRAAIVISNYEGIVPTAEVFYLHSILYSTSRCLDSFREYESFKSQNVGADYLVSIVQEAVGHAAALSRYFWPSLQRGRKLKPLELIREKRGKRLREFFALTEESPLYNRELRNAWEHFDERLDAYLLKNESGFFFPGCLVDSHRLADDPLGHIFKLLDINAECLVLMGCKYFFTPIRDEVKAVFEKAVRADQNGARLKSPLAVR